MPKPWLVISNCQTVGLANCLTLLCPEVTIEACHIWRFKAEQEAWIRRLPEFDELIVTPEFESVGSLDFSARSNVTYVPTFFFRAFHPDITTLFCGGKAIQTPMHDYHSVIVFAAYKHGLSESRAAQLFSAEFLRMIDFGSIWAVEKQALLANFRASGFELKNDFVRWMRDGPFMHTINHPKIGALYDIARQIVAKIGVKTVTESALRPHDNLLVGPIWPIYPEIADELGLPGGSYLFKGLGSYRQFNLNEFIAGSYSAYRAYDADDLNSIDPHYHFVAKLMEEQR